jgi:serine/threonine protein kinase
MQLIPGQIVGKYVNRQLLGSGSFGSVYLMHDNLMNRDVAVKFVENKNPQAFVAHMEAQILNQCRHDRIVSVNSVDVLAIAMGNPYAIIDMEFLSGGSAFTLLQNGFVSVRRSTKALIDVLFALEHTHRQGVLHRDVKPSNIMVSENRFKLGDFGIARDAAGAMIGSGRGTPVYCAPEILNNNVTSISTDLFAAGMTFFQLVNNVVDFDAYIKSHDPIKSGKVISTVGYAGLVPRRIRIICNRACALDPSDRYASAAEMRQALEKLHIRQDWVRQSPDTWEAQVSGQTHAMLIESAKRIENVYLVNGRRRNANCSVASSVDEAKAAQERWVNEHTF